MNDFDARVDRHYGLGGLMERIEAGLGLAGKEVNSLTLDDLAPVDAFHTRGREATIEVAKLGSLNASHRVLDVGCGLGGTARHLAHVHKCHVTAIDLTEEYISVGTRLTELVGLSDRVELRQASALAIPYEDETFDIVWTEHAQMNIADKERFYSEIARVLKPGGRLLFHDVFRGNGDEPVYPTPWAEDESISSLATATVARSNVEQAGLSIDHWIEKDRESVAFFEKVIARIEADGLPPVGLHLLMGKNARDKLKNYTRNIAENRVAVAMGMATRK